MQQRRQTSGQGGSIAKPTPLSQIFKEQPQLGWQILDIQSCLYSEMEVTLQRITSLTALYMRAIQSLNACQDSREQYFNLKMQKLMAEPYVIRCFNNTQNQKRSALDARRKELQQQVERQIEKQNHKKVVQQAISAQEEKEKKLLHRVRDIVDQQNRRLQQRIRKRNQIREMRSSIFKGSQILGPETSAMEQSTGGCQMGMKSAESQMNGMMTEEDYRKLRGQIQHEQQQYCLQNGIKRYK